MYSNTVQRTLRVARDSSAIPSSKGLAPSKNVLIWEFREEFSASSRILTSADNSRAQQPLISVDVWGVQLSYRGGVVILLRGVQLSKWVVYVSILYK
jgi:hypothetical protein